MLRLEGKAAVITGGAGEIGLSAAGLFIKEGASVLLVDLEEEALKKAVDSLESDAAAYAAADVSKPEQVEMYVKKAAELFGGIDILLNNAGIEGMVKPIPEYPIDEFDRVMAVNVRGVWLGLKYVIPEMVKRGGGSIIITSSVAGVGGSGDMSAYATSKHAVIGMMRSAAIEGGPFNIRVNTVNPSPIEGRMMRSIEDGKAPGAGQEVKAMIETRIPLGRYGTPEDVASIMLFLASDEGRFCNGGVYMVDGGLKAS